MHPYVPLVAAATLISAACGGALCLQHRRRRSSQLAGVLLIGSAVWGSCQILACLSGSPEQATLWFRVSAFGWLFIGPVTLHLFSAAMGDGQRAVRRTRTALYSSSVLLLVPTLTTDQVVASSLPVDWGYWAVFGPLYPVVYLITALGVGLAGWVALRSLSRLSAAERRQAPWVVFAAAVPFSVASVTDALLPMLGIVFPPLGTTAFAVLGVLSVWVVVHYGYSMVTPGPFAEEILALLPDGVAMLHGDERIRAANAGLARLSGRSVAELQGRHIGELLSLGFESEEFDGVDCELQGESGRRVPVSVSASALRDRQGNALGRVLVVRDLCEIADLRRSLVVSARLAAVGELAAGVAHEINNPLAFVRSNLSQFEELWKRVRSELAAAGREQTLGAEIKDIEELMEESLEGVDRAAEIVRNVKSFAHAGSGERQLADLNQLLDDVVRVASPQLRGRAAVETDYAEVPPIPCTPQQLRQVFLNLVLNASHALDGPGTIRIATQAIDGSVEVCVADDGVGIEPDVMERIFDPFFTTKPVGEGTGLGLGIAHQIVEQHHGKILVESTPGEGSRFSVQLPLE